MIFATLTLVALAADPAVIRTAKSGPWSAASTWDGGKVPAAGQKVKIRAGHAVVYDLKSDAVLRSVHIAGLLSFDPGRDTLLNAGLIRIHGGEGVEEEGFEAGPHAAKGVPATLPGPEVRCLCCEGKPALLVGTPERPIDARFSAVIRLHYIAGMDKESCPAIVCCGGRMDLHGAPMNRTWVRLGASVHIRKKGGGPAEIVLAEAVTGWRPGDRVIVTASDPGRPGQRAEERTIKAISGTRVTLDRPLENAHVGEGEFRSEVANLSRNVVVESADPAGVRGHTMYHHGSAGGISYAELRHLGKKGVLGRYAIHYHLCQDTMRGSSVIGASIRDSHNRWLTVHGTEYLVVRDCVGYKSVGHGFFLEDGTESYNVFDRNLAVQALEGEPLPKQMLPFDKNDGAGFWWACSLNTFTRNAAAECGQYGFRFDATPKAGAVVNGRRFGEPSAEFDLRLMVRQPDGSRRKVDVRALPFVRFEDNDSHGNGKWGLNMGQHSGGKVGPDASTPFVIRRMRIWQVVGGFGVEVPNVLIDGMTIHQAGYGVRESRYVAQDYRNVSIQSREPAAVSTLEQYKARRAHTSRVRQPGWPAGTGDGGPSFQPASVEVAKLVPVDKLPPITVITHVRKDGGRLLVRGTTSDDGTVKEVTVNGEAARALSANFAEWEALIAAGRTGTVKLEARAADDAGNAEKTPHRMEVVIR